MSEKGIDMSKYARWKAESKSHEDSGFEGGCPFPQATERMSLRDHFFKEKGMKTDERDEQFRR